MRDPAATGFWQWLAALLDGGVPMHAALECLRGEHRGGPLEPAIAACAAAVWEGASLADAGAAWPALASPMAVALIREGEQTGALVACLEAIPRLAALEVRDPGVRFLASLGALIRAGVPLERGCAWLAEAGTGEPWAGLARDVGSALARGDAFAAALAARPHLVPGYAVALLHGAEIEGRLDEALRALALDPAADPGLPVPARACHALANLIAAGTPMADALALAAQPAPEAAPLLRAAAATWEADQSLAAGLEGCLPAPAVRLVREAEQHGDLVKAFRAVARLLAP